MATLDELLARALAGPKPLAPTSAGSGDLLNSLVQSAQTPQPARASGGGGGGGGAAPPGNATLEEIIFGGNSYSPSSADSSHQSHLHLGGYGAPKVLNWINKLPGFAVGENRKHGGVAPVHTGSSWHYRDRSGKVRGDKQGVLGGDINYVGGGRFDNETAALSWLERKLNRRYR